MVSRRFIYYTLTVFIAGILALVFMQYNSSLNMENLITGNERLVNEFAVSNDLKDLERNINFLERRVEGVVANNIMLPIEGFGAEISAIKENLGELQLIDDDDSTVKYIGELTLLVDKKLAFSKQVLDTFFFSGKQSAQNLIAAQKGNGLMASITDICDKIDNSRQHFLAAITASIDESGRKARRWGIVFISLAILSAMGLFWFIVNRIKQQQLLIEQLDASEKKVRESAMIKEKFMANMSHEIRTPMNALLGFTDLLKNRELEPEARRFVQYIQTSGTSLLNIINNVLDLSKIEAGMMRIESNPFNIRELAQSVKILFKEKANDKGLYFNTSIAASIPDILVGDATRLSQVLVNLVGNAIKFTEQGGIDLQIYDEGQHNNHITLGFTVTDTGIGIEKNKLPYIFDRFQQAEDSITRKYGGTGLGLSIVKELISLQGGRIKAESEPGKGSIFTVSLTYPVNASQAPLIPSSHDHPDIPGLRRLKILAAEDNELNQRLLEHLLAGWDMDLQIAGNGREALDMLKTRSFDLVLMDIQMPVIDGYTAIRAIRDELKLAVPVIAMTAHALKGEREKCLAQGMNDYISKPLKKEALYLLILRHTDAEALKDHAQTRAIQADNFAVIDLQYLKELSGGDKEYEKEMTKQFMEAIPGEIRSLEEAFHNNDLPEIRRIAHQLRTTISVMGLNEALNPSLDGLEYNYSHAQSSLNDFHIIKTICLGALAEAGKLLENYSW